MLETAMQGYLTKKRDMGTCVSACRMFFVLSTFQIRLPAFRFCKALFEPAFEGPICLL
jgi:hypothetical protein